MKNSFSDLSTFCCIGQSLFLDDMTNFHKNGDLNSLIVSKIYNEILVQLGKLLKVLWSSNVLEYTPSSIMNLFCVDHDIIHQTSCAHNSTK